MELMQNLWTPEYQGLLMMLKEDIIARPTLERPDPSRIFYIKTDWYNDEIGAVLLQ